MQNLAFHSDAEAGLYPTLHFDADPGPTFHSDADPDPAPHQNDANLQLLAYRPSMAPQVQGESFALTQIRIRLFILQIRIRH